MTDVFLDIDGQPNESLSIISERLEARSLSGKFQEFTNKYFDLIEVDNRTNILELGGGTGVIGRNFIEYKNFSGKYTVSDLSAKLLKYGRQKAKRQNLDKVLKFMLLKESLTTIDRLIDCSWSDLADKKYLSDKTLGSISKYSRSSLFSSESISTSSIPFE